MSISCDLCVFSCISLCDGLILCPEEFYEQRCVIVRMRRFLPALG
jgi:hypothetical protein